MGAHSRFFFLKTVDWEMLEAGSGMSFFLLLASHAMLDTLEF